MPANGINHVIKVLVVDDQMIVLQGIAALLTISKKVNVIATASSGTQSIELLTQGLLPDVILLDMNMPNMDGLETLTAIKKITDSPVIFLTTFDDPYKSRKGIQLGAKGWLLKNISLDELVDAVTSVASGNTLISKHQLAKVRNCSNNECLTPREQLIAKALTEGKTNKEIALSLHLSPGTVKNYTSNVFKKLGVRNRSEAIIKLSAEHIFD